MNGAKAVQRSDCNLLIRNTFRFRGFILRDARERAPQDEVCVPRMQRSAPLLCVVRC
jgi:hypothetical protein